MADKKTIYITDQDDRSRAETRALLEEEGFAVEDYNNGDDALVKAADAPPDLFITSMGIKGSQDGLKYVRALKATDSLKAIPVILHTGAHQIMHLPFNFAPDPVWFPVVAVIEKPARREYFLEVVNDALNADPIATA